MDGTIALRKGASRMLLNGRKLKDDAVHGKLKPGKCQIVHRPSKINTCDNARESLGKTFELTSSINLCAAKNSLT